MADIEIKIEDHSDEILRQLAQNVEAGLEACGNQAVSHAKQTLRAKIPRHASWYSPTGKLANSVTHSVTGDEMHVGTNTDYAIYNEYGTGIYAEGGGRQSPWAYQGSDGEWHQTRGITPTHFIKNSLANHIAEYKAILEKFLMRF